MEKGRERNEEKRSCVLFPFLPLFAPLPEGEVRRGISLPIRNLVKNCGRGALKKSIFRIETPHGTCVYGIISLTTSILISRLGIKGDPASFVPIPFVCELDGQRTTELPPLPFLPSPLVYQEEEETSLLFSFLFLSWRQVEKERNSRDSGRATPPIEENKGKGRRIYAKNPSITGSRVVNAKLIEGNDVFRAEPLRVTERRRRGSAGIFRRVHPIKHFCYLARDLFEG